MPDPARCRRGAPWLLAVLALAAGLHALGSRPPARSAAAAGARPFGLPLAGPPGLSTWHLSQAYGNTTYAYGERSDLYSSGQGMHMGIDLATACGTPVVAIGDGTVISVDGRGGSPPHNLMIRHPEGYVSFYGHLLERPVVAVGQSVQRGQPVAFTGDMNGNCNGSPHLHLEIRDTSLNRTYNPVTLIDADWHGIALLGPRPLTFERDLDVPRQWQSLDDQPPLVLGGPLLNDYEKAWPAAR
jgi:murein DD-endopeptidase MepM/ murein hydrolase activator NlpD